MDTLAPDVKPKYLDYCEYYSHCGSQGVDWATCDKGPWGWDSDYDGRRNCGLGWPGPRNACWACLPCEMLFDQELNEISRRQGGKWMTPSERGAKDHERLLRENEERLQRRRAAEVAERRRADEAKAERAAAKKRIQDEKAAIAAARAKAEAVTRAEDGVLESASAESIAQGDHLAPDLRMIALRHTESSVRAAAVEALGASGLQNLRFGTPTALRFLEELSREGADRRLRLRAKELHETVQRELEQRRKD